MRDPGNLGTVLRTGDAVGAGGLILLDDSVDPFSVEAVRASMGAIFTQKLVQARWDEFLPWLRGGPGQLVATWLGEDTQDYQAVRYAAPTFILTGNESQGMPPAYADAADVLLGKPKMRQEAQPRLVQQAQHGVVAHVPAVIDVRDPHVQFRAEREIHAVHIQFHSCHGRH